MNRSVKLSAFAKANLSLDITGKKNGMHELDSVMTTVDRCDYVTVAERADENIFVRFDNAEIDPINNTAYRAAKAVQDVIGGNGWDITIEKGIPIGAGLGGSSADGAAVLRALDVLYKLPERGVDMRAVALSVGSDVPFMLTGGLARVRGTGDDLFFMDSKLRLFGIGLMSGAVSTRECYAEFDRQNPSGAKSAADNDKLCELLMNGSPDAMKLFGNVLTKPAAALNASIPVNADILSKHGATVCMTGSGSMVIGWFDDIEKLGAGAAALTAEGINFTVLSTAKTGVLHRLGAVE